MPKGWSGQQKSPASIVIAMPPAGWNQAKPCPRPEEDDEAIGWVPEREAPVNPAIIRGPQGPPGDLGGRLRKKAATSILRATAVRAVEDGEYAAVVSPYELNDVDMVLGITMNDAEDRDDELEIARAGEIELPQWDFIPFHRVFLGPAGILVQFIDPVWTFVCVVGIALGPNKLLVDIRPAVIL